MMGETNMWDCFNINYPSGNIQACFLFRVNTEFYIGEQSDVIGCSVDLINAIKSNKLDGMYAEYFEDGGTKVRGDYRLGKRHGEWAWYYPNNAIKKKCTYVDGKLDGEYSRYNIGGGVLHRIQFIKGEPLRLF